MTEIIGHIKEIVCGFNGVFIKQHDYLINDELREMKEDILSDLEMVNSTQDRINLNSDVNNVVSDIKKTVLKYKEEV